MHVNMLKLWSESKNSSSHDIIIQRADPKCLKYPLRKLETYSNNLNISNITANKYNGSGLE